MAQKSARRDEDHTEAPTPNGTNEDATADGPPAAKVAAVEEKWHPSISAAVIQVTDQERAVKWWTEKMDFEVVYDKAMGPPGAPRWIEVKSPNGATKLVLSLKGDGHAVGPEPGSESNIFFGTPELEKTAAEMEKRGVKFLMKPATTHWGSMATFVDCDDNKFTLLSTQPYTY